MKSEAVGGKKVKSYLFLLEENERLRGLETNADPQASPQKHIVMQHCRFTLADPCECRNKSSHFMFVRVQNL